MILETYYEQKKEKIEELLVDKQVHLYNDYAFTTTGASSFTFPLLMFRYDDVSWTTSSEKEYKADVTFCIDIVYSPNASENMDMFDLAAKVDDAVLKFPTRNDIIGNETLISNSVLKLREENLSLENDYWEKSNYKIWRITYKTTLIEKDQKQKYTLITNRDVFPTSEDLNNYLSSEGYSNNPTDYENIVEKEVDEDASFYKSTDDIDFTDINAPKLK